ncbi:MAG TPA: hypothetical protein VFQ96_06370 [Microbacteriaceae bacterium]|nr:hypothetical protein [Microbacteriaceae bacterium]
MKAAPEEQRRLLDVQRIDNAITKARSTADEAALGAELAGIEAELTRARHEQLERAGALEDGKTALARIESDVAAVDARAARDTARLHETSSLKDIHGLEAELRSLAERKDRLEDTQLEAMEELDGLGRAASAAESLVDETARRKADAEARRRTSAAERQSRLEELSAERRDALVGLPEDLVALYEKQRARYGIGAALLRGGVSLGSNTTLNPADMQDIRRAAPDDVILCPESSCILVRTEESGL